MKGITIKRPSAAMIVAVVALFAALAGTAVAGPVSDLLSKQEKKQTRKISRSVADKQITKRAPGLSVASAQNSQDAQNAQNAVNAQSAVNSQNAGNADTLDGIDSAGFLQGGTRSRSISDTTQDSDYGTDVNLAQLSNLEGGRWTITAKLQVDNDGGAAESIDCDLIKNSTVDTQLDSSLQSLGPNAAGAQVLNYILIAETTTLAAGTDDLYLRCTQVGADNDADEMRIVAHKVD